MSRNANQGRFSKELSDKEAREEMERILKANSLANKLITFLFALAAIVACLSGIVSNL